MRILTVHNYPGDYALGGEGNVFEQEAEMLCEHRHAVLPFRCTNAEFMTANIIKKARAFWNAPWSPYGYRLIQEQIRRFRPDVMHVHNFFFVLSPSILKAAKDAGVPTVTTLHNFRLISPCSQLFRNGRVCEKCVGRNPWRIMLYRCYKDSFLASLFRYNIYYRGKQRYQWIDLIDAFIALTEFGKRKYVEGGMPGDRIHVKPNFVDDPLCGTASSPGSEGAAFIGRISSEKGILTLLKAWHDVDYPLTIVGKGPQMSEARRMAPKNVVFLGERPREEALAVMKRMSFVLFPSILYETFGLAIVEAMALGRAVVASNLGPRKELVRDGETGLLFQPGDEADLRQKVSRLIANPDICKEMGSNGRRDYLDKFTKEKNYERLLSIYETAREHHQATAKA